MTGLPALLTIVFVIAKILGYITWPWLWVLAPAWISVLVTLVILAGTLLFVAVGSWFTLKY